MMDIILPAAGFGLLVIADILFSRISRLFRTVLSFAGYALVVVAILQIVFYSGTVSIPGLLILGWSLSILFGSLLIYSVFIEIPLLKSRKYSPQSETVMSGTYGICRHPGFWWLLFLLASAAMIHGNPNAVLKSFYIVVFNLVLILLQDRFFFPEQFGNYRDYTEKVPFLFPVFGRTSHESEQKNHDTERFSDGA